MCVCLREREREREIEGGIENLERDKGDSVWDVVKYDGGMVHSIVRVFVCVCVCVCVCVWGGGGA